MGRNKNLKCKDESNWSARFLAMNGRKNSGLKEKHVVVHSLAHHKRKTSSWGM